MALLALDARVPVQEHLLLIADRLAVALDALHGEEEMRDRVDVRVLPQLVRVELEPENLPGDRGDGGLVLGVLTGDAWSAPLGDLGPPAARHPLGRRVGFHLGRRAGRLDGQVSRRRGPATLLHDVRELVGQQPEPRPGLGRVPPEPEDEVAPDGVGPRADRPGRRRRQGARVHANAAEVVAEAGLHPAPDGRLEGTAGRAQHGLDAVGRLRGPAEATQGAH